MSKRKDMENISDVLALFGFKQEGVEIHSLGRKTIE
jgi:hypothetical protein